MSLYTFLFELSINIHPLRTQSISDVFLVNCRSFADNGCIARINEKLAD